MKHDTVLWWKELGNQRTKSDKGDNLIKLEECVYFETSAPLPLMTEQKYFYKCVYNNKQAILEQNKQQIHWWLHFSPEWNMIGICVF